MKITFKDVGQGDSIILEWTNDGSDKIGIIDCSKKNNNNPVLDYLKNSTYKEIEFVVLSHPHSDHYNGMVELFSYIEHAGIYVNNFYHSLLILGPEYYKYLHLVEIDTEAIKMLKEITEITGALREKNFIRRINPVFENTRIDLAENMYLKALSPSQREAEIYMKMIGYEPYRDKKKSSSAANYLSTLFKLVVNDKYCLLTSDCEPETFLRVLSERAHPEFHNKALFLGQLPHHGAEKNYVPAFWDAVIREDLRHAVVSAGSNFKYKHPHFPVIKGFFDNGYQIHATNIVHGMEEFLAYLSKYAKRTAILDSVSVLEKDYSGGEKTFQL